MTESEQFKNNITVFGLEHLKDDKKFKNARMISRSDLKDKHDYEYRLASLVIFIKDGVAQILKNKYE